MSFTLAQIHLRCEEFGDCLLWKQSCTPNGYPRVSGGYAHIMAWECVHGPVPEGMRVRRTCDESRCCNVGHMELATRKQVNRLAAKRGAWKGSSARAAAISVAARKRSPLTAEDVAAIRASDETGVALADRHGVSPSLISKIRHHKTWAPQRAGSVFSGALA